MRTIRPQGSQRQRDRSTTSATRRKQIEPAFIEPMQCKPVSSLPTAENWTFEIKFDGYRCLAVKRASEVILFSRNEKVLNKRFPKIVDALASLEGKFVLDGELVAFDTQGRPSFQVLQSTPSHEVPVFFYVFDLLNQNGELLLSSRGCAVANFWLNCCLAPTIRFACRLSFRPRRDTFLRPCASLTWKGLSASEWILPTNLANDREHGSNTVRTESKSSSLAVTFLVRTV